MKSFSLIQLYFVLATLTGLILIIVGSVTLVRMGLDKVVGVKPYPNFSAPYPPNSDLKNASEAATVSQKQALAQWEQEYAQWQEETKGYDQVDQQIKRDLTQALAMMLVGAPVFLVHSPRLFKKHD